MSSSDLVGARGSSWELVGELSAGWLLFPTHPPSRRRDVAVRGGRGGAPLLQYYTTARLALLVLACGQRALPLERLYCVRDRVLRYFVR